MKIIISAFILALIPASAAPLGKLSDYPALEIWIGKSPSPDIQDFHPSGITVAWNQVLKRPTTTKVEITSDETAKSNIQPVEAEKDKVDYTGIFSALTKTVDSFTLPKSTEAAELAVAAKRTPENGRSYILTVKNTHMYFTMYISEASQPETFNNAAELWTALEKELSPQQRSYIATYQKKK